MATLGLLAVGLPGCARIWMDHRSAVGEAVVRVTPLWVKDKRDRFDALLVVENRSGSRLVVHPAELRCKRGRHAGRVRAPRKSVFIDPGRERDVLVICDGVRRAGPFVVELARVRHRATGTPILLNLVWAATAEGRPASQMSPGAVTAGRPPPRTADPVVEVDAPPPAPPAAKHPPTTPPRPRSASAGLEAAAPPAAVRRYRIGLELFRAGNLVAAADEFRAALELYPDSDHLRLWLARAQNGP